MSNTTQALAQFAQDYTKACENETGKLPQVTFDESWRSPCEVSDSLDDEKVSWEPFVQTTPFNFSDIENALEFTLHHSVKDFYSHLFSGFLYGQWQTHQLVLIQCWNDDDIKRLCENIIGHILMQRKLKQSHTVFIGSVINSEKMLCVDNASGEVVLETPGNDKREVVADSLVDFLEQLTPLTVPEEELAYQAPVEIKPGLMPRLREVMRSLLGR